MKTTISTHKSVEITDEVDGFHKHSAATDGKPRVVIGSLPYDVVIIDQGSGEWYHGFENPLQHRWHGNGNRATCLVCHQVIEKQFRNEA